MYKVNDYVVCKQDICKIRAIKKENGKESYIMIPINDDSLTLRVPVDNKKLLRNIMTKEEAKSLIAKIPSIMPIENESKNVENDYKLLLKDESLESIVKIIKSTYQKNEGRKKLGKKISEKDDLYFQKAELRLLSELSIVFDMSITEVREYLFEVMDKKKEFQ